MRFIINVILSTKESRNYLIDAKDEDEAKERLKLRLPPKDRENIKIDSIKIDPNSIKQEDPYGIFSED